VKESLWTVSSFINKHATIAGGIRNAIYHQQKMGNFNKTKTKKLKNQQKKCNRHQQKK